MFPISSIGSDIQELSEHVINYTNDHLIIPEFVVGFELSTAYSETRTGLYPAGEIAAENLLNEFISNRGKEYSLKRNFPSVEGTSKLSPYLASGIISARKCLECAMKANGGRVDSGNAGYMSWISELCWRDFYKHILVSFPRVGKGLPFKLDTDKVEWKVSEEKLQAWKDGMTGFPIVDAGNLKNYYF